MGSNEQQEQNHNSGQESNKVPKTSGEANAKSDTPNTEQGYQIAPEDTLIGYDGDESQLDMDLGNENDHTKNRGIDDND